MITLRQIQIEERRGLLTQCDVLAVLHDADDLDIAPDGSIYFSDASTRVDTSSYQSVVAEYRPNGRVLRLDPDGTVETVVSNVAAANGIATARGLAHCYAAMIGDVDGHRLFAPATLTLARTEESAGPDRVLVVNTRFGLGYMLHGPSAPLLAAGSFGHPGRGGSLGFADPEAGIAFGYVTNGLQKGVTADPRSQALIRALRSAL